MKKIFELIYKLKNKDLIILTISIILILFSIYFNPFIQNKYELRDNIHKLNQDSILQRKIDNIENDKYRDFSNLIKLKRFEIINNKEIWVPKQNINGVNSVNKIISVKGNFKKIYLYIKLSSDNEPLTQKQSIYLKLFNTKNEKKEDTTGGHLYRPLSLPIPQANKTILLYNIENIPFLYKIPYLEDRIPLNINWFRLFQDGNEIKLITFISSKKRAKIEDLSLFYECESGSDCNITFSK